MDDCIEKQQLNYLMGLMILDNGGEDDFLKSYIKSYRRYVIITTPVKTIHHFIQVIINQILEELLLVGDSIDLNFLQGKFHFINSMKV